MSIIKRLPILLPDEKIDPQKWAVIACDQFTTDRDYWMKLDEFVGDSPSTLRLIFPEIFLKDSDFETRVEKINSTMYEYLNKGVFDEYDGFIMTERSIANGKKRVGLVLCVDLEEYDFVTFDKQIRPTEETIQNRLPVRIRIRENAPIELPHILLLIDDKKRSVIEPLYENRENFTKVYDFDLNMNGGNIKGYHIPFSETLLQRFQALLDNDLQISKYGKNANILFAVGDGNHSMATAKKCWEAIKPTLSDDEKLNHPARYALVEVVNLYDDAITFEPIHRVIYNFDDNFINRLSSNLFGDGTVTLITTNGTRTLPCPMNADETIKIIQNFLEDEISRNKICVEYVHDAKQVQKNVFDNNGIGIYMPRFEKSRLFDYTVNKGRLPKKAFSIGEESTKKYYMEAKRIK